MYGEYLQGRRRREDTISCVPTGSTAHQESLAPAPAGVAMLPADEGRQGPVYRQVFFT